jgi:hypothetical protein
VIITMEHVRATAGFNDRDSLCAIGARKWFRQHNLDFRSFLKNGIEEEVLLATGDAFALAVVEQAHGR